MRIYVRFCRAFLAVCLGVCGVVWASPSASADAHATGFAEVRIDDADIENGRCDIGEFCLYYNSVERGLGSLHDFPWSQAYLGEAKFKSAGAGRGRVVDNDAAAYWNRTTADVTVYVRDRYETLNGDYNGRYGWVPAGRKGNFSAGYKNQVSSFWCPACVWS